jgi:YD repeat-containing protein
MKKGILAICLGMILFISCSKTDLLNFKWDRHAQAEGYVANCKLRSFTYDAEPGQGYITKGTFTYAPNGHPTSLIFTGPILSESPNRFFYYDQKHRLIEYREATTADDPILAVWHRYGYNNKNQIITDTVLNPKVVFDDGSVMPEALRMIATFTYDNQERIIKEVQNWLGSTPFTHTITYAYDARGNLVVDGWDAAWYDDKVSFLRSHPVFTFLSRNYSKNNPLKPSASTPARKYNSKKLPLSVNPNNDYFFSAYYGIDSLTYDCK